MNKQIEDKFKDQDKYIGNLCDKVTRVESHICKIEKHLDMYPELEPKDSSILFITNSELSPKIKAIFTQQSNHLQEKNEKIEKLKEQLTNQIHYNKILRIRLENYKPIVVYKDAAAGIEQVTKDKNAKIEELEYNNHSYKNRIQKCCDENLNLKSKIKELKRNHVIQSETIRNLRERIIELCQQVNTEADSAYLLRKRIKQLESEGCCIMSEKRDLKFSETCSDVVLGRAYFNDLRKTQTKYFTLLAAIEKSKED